jgi:hypothetical protein
MCDRLPHDAMKIWAFVIEGSLSDRVAFRTAAEETLATGGVSNPRESRLIRVVSCGTAPLLFVIG